MEFRWNDWNLEHISRHGIDPDEAETVVHEAHSPYPMSRSDDKWLVWGPGLGERPLQVVFILDEDDAVFVIHARPLTEAERRRYRRNRR